MSVTFRALANATLATGVAAIYSASGVSAQVDDARVTNTSAATLTVSLWRVSSGGAPSDANIVLLAESMPAGASTRLNIAGLTLDAGMELWASASVGGVATLALSGRERG